MSEENKHMDEAFRKASGETKAVYNSSFWTEVEAKLNDASLDDAFRAAALGAVASPSFVPTDAIEDMFMDSAFVEASSETTVAYNPSFFEQFKASEANLEMDSAFQAAAAASVVDYAPQFWNDADKALQKEGLHYEYQSAYWGEAKKLLDKSDRKGFFLQWSAVAALLITASFLVGMLGMNVDPAIRTEGLASSSQLDIDNRLAQFDLDVNQENGNALDASENFNLLADNNNNNDNSQNQYSNDLVNGVNEIHNLGNAPSINLAHTVKKSPIFSVDEPTVSGIDFTDLDILAPLRLNEDIAHVNFETSRSLNFPPLEINKGQDKPRGVHSISVIAAVGGGNQWSSSSLIPSQRSSFGAEYLFSPTGKLRNFNFGARFNVSHVQQNGLLKNQQHVQYDINGGADRYFYILQYTDLFFTNFSFVTDYRIAPKHKFTATIGLDYLAAARSNMSYKNSPHSADISTVNDNWGVKDGLNQFDFRLGIGYEFQLTNKFAILLQANTGFLDRTNNDFFENDFKDIEGRLMLGLKYNIFRKI